MGESIEVFLLITKLVIAIFPLCFWHKIYQYLFHSNCLNFAIVMCDNLQLTTQQPPQPNYYHQVLKVVKYQAQFLTYSAPNT